MSNPDDVNWNPERWALIRPQARTMAAMRASCFAQASIEGNRVIASSTWSVLTPAEDGAGTWGHRP